MLRRVSRCVRLCSELFRSGFLFLSGDAIELRSLRVSCVCFYLFVNRSQAK